MAAYVADGLTAAIVLFVFVVRLIAGGFRMCVCVCVRVACVCDVHPFCLL